MSENLNLSLDGMSFYLKTDRDKNSQERSFIKTHEFDNEIMKQPEFLENVKKTLNMKKVDKNAKKADESTNDLNLLLNVKNQNFALQSKLANLNADNINNLSDVTKIANDNHQKNKQIIDELFEKLNK